MGPGETTLCTVSTKNYFYDLFAICSLLQHRTATTVMDSNQQNSAPSNASHHKKIYEINHISHVSHASHVR